MVLLDVGSGLPLARWSDGAAEARFSRDGKQLIRAYNQGGISVLDLNTAQARTISESAGKKMSLAVPRSAFDAPRLDRFGERVAFLLKEDTAGIWEVRSGNRLATLNKARDVPLFSGDGMRLYAVAREWDARTGRALRDLPGKVLATSPDGRWLAVASDLRAAEDRAWKRRAVAILEARTGRVHGHLFLRQHPRQEGIFNPRNAPVAFSPNGDRILERDFAGVRIWDVDACLPLTAPVRARTSRGDNVKTARFFPDGKRVLLVDGGIQVWSPARRFAGMAAEELVALARLHSGQKVLPGGVIVSAEWGELERMRRRFPELFSAPSLRQEASWLWNHLERVSHSSSRQEAAWLRHQQGAAWLRKGGYGPAELTWLSRIVELELDPRLRTKWRVRRAEVLTRCDYRRALDEVEQLSRGQSLEHDTLYDLACIAARCAAEASRDPARPLPERDRQAEVCSRQALALLQRARQAGFFKEQWKIRHMKTDTNLDFLRDRADFKRWLAALEPPR
jgi:hypothetical protein